MEFQLSHHNLLRPHIVTIDKAQHIHARDECGMRNVECGMSNLSAVQLAPHHVNHLQHSLAVDDDVAVADEGKGLIVAICVLADGSEHQTEARLVVGGLGGEGVTGP